MSNKMTCLTTVTCGDDYIVTNKRIWVNTDYEKLLEVYLCVSLVDGSAKWMTAKMIQKLRGESDEV